MKKKAMKHYLPIAFYLVIFVSCANKGINRETEPKEQMTGAYTSKRTITKDELKLFNDTYKGKVKLSPVSVSTQVVAGTNYQYVCKDDKGNKYEVVIYQKLPCYGGEAEVTSMAKIK